MPDIAVPTQDASLVPDGAVVEAPGQALNSSAISILSALQRLDSLLERAAAASAEALGSGAAADGFRGLYITPEEIDRLLRRPPGVPPFSFLPPADANAAESSEAATLSPLEMLAASIGLDSFEAGVLLLALAPEVDTRYERIYAYLQDDVTRRRPTVELALNLFSSSAAEKLTNRKKFGSDAALFRSGLLRLRADPPSAPLIGQFIDIDPGIASLLLGQRPDSRLAAAEPGACIGMADEMLSGLQTLVNTARRHGSPCRLYFQGRVDDTARVADRLAAGVASPLDAADMASLPEADDLFASTLAALLSPASLSGSLLFLAGMDSLIDPAKGARRRRLFEAIERFSGPVILSGEQPWEYRDCSPLGILAIRIGVPEYAERRSCWDACARELGASLPDSDLDALASRFRLTPGQIREATASAHNRVVWRQASVGGEIANAQSAVNLGAADFMAGAREQSGSDLAALTTKLHPTQGWEDLVVPPETREQLEQICQRVVNQQRVMSAWGFERKLSTGRGITALFSGPSGTGKTMAAEVVASRLQLDIYRIDLAGVVSKYIGETEQRLDRIFNAAENANAILFFDEADALFGKRSEVHDSHDRYANIEVAYLLQKMDLYEGVAILASNLRQNMDDAFTRRLQFIAEFPFPDESYRESIWRLQLPSDAPRDDDIDYGFLARRFQLSGGGIKNAALSAAFLAASEGENVRIGMVHLVRGAAAEYRKMGKVIDESEFASLYGTSRSAGALEPALLT